MSVFTRGLTLKFVITIVLSLETLTVYFLPYNRQISKTLNLP